VRFDGDPPGNEQIQIGFLPPESAALDGPSFPKRLSVWTARVAVVTHFTAGRTWQSAELAWGLFNNAVLTARATVTSNGQTFEHEFSTYAPMLVLKPPSRISSGIVAGKCSGSR
jgi:hypothetical protein